MNEKKFFFLNNDIYFLWDTFPQAYVFNYLSGKLEVVVCQSFVKYLRNSEERDTKVHFFHNKERL